MAHHVRMTQFDIVYIWAMALVGIGLAIVAKTKRDFRAYRSIWMVGADHDRPHGICGCAKLEHRIAQQKRRLIAAPFFICN